MFPVDHLRNPLRAQRFLPEANPDQANQDLATLKRKIILLFPAVSPGNLQRLNQARLEKIIVWHQDSNRLTQFIIERAANWFAGYNDSFIGFEFSDSFREERRMQPEENRGDVAYHAFWRIVKRVIEPSISVTQRRDEIATQLGIPADSIIVDTLCNNYIDLVHAREVCLYISHTGLISRMRVLRKVMGDMGEPMLLLLGDMQFRG